MYMNNYIYSSCADTQCIHLLLPLLSSSLCNACKVKTKEIHFNRCMHACMHARMQRDENNSRNDNNRNIHNGNDNNNTLLLIIIRVMRTTKVEIINNNTNKNK